MKTPDWTNQDEVDEYCMNQALMQAKKAYNNDETPIGCIILYENKIIARGYNRRKKDKSALSHAEITAIKKAGHYIGDWRLDGCTMYVTLEPCPMCAGAIVQSRVDRVVIGTKSPKSGCAGSIMNLLQDERLNHQCEITWGVLETQSRELIQKFFKEMRLRVKENTFDKGL